MFFPPCLIAEQHADAEKHRKWTVIQTKLSASPSVCERVDFISLLLSFLKPTQPSSWKFGTYMLKTCHDNKISLEFTVKLSNTYWP